MRRLAECPWFKGAYRKVYDIVSIGNRLPRAEEITVLDPDDFRPTKESVMACARRRRGGCGSGISRRLS